MFFLTAVCRNLGPGLGAATVLGVGALGNLLNAWFHGFDHVSVGASTAVFGALGVLGGMGVVQRRRLGIHGRRAWIPLAAGVAILAMIGTGGPRVDLWAHLWGFVAGAGAGIAPLSMRSGRKPPGFSSGSAWWPRRRWCCAGWRRLPSVASRKFLP